MDIHQSSGGPPLVFDHQMVIDNESRMLYVFGGRIVDGEWDTVKCAGMYCYNVRKSKWSCIMYDSWFVPSRIISNQLLSGRRCRLRVPSQDQYLLVLVSRTSCYHGPATHRIHKGTLCYSTPIHGYCTSSLGNEMEPSSQTCIP